MVILAGETGKRSRPLRRGRRREHVAPVVIAPGEEQDEVEDDCQHRAHRQRLDSRRETDGYGEKDENDIAGIAKVGSEPHRRDDTGQAERERKTVTHDEHYPRDDQRENDQGLYYRLSVPGNVPGRHVHPRHRQHQHHRTQQHQRGGHRQLEKRSGAQCGRRGGWG